MAGHSKHLGGSQPCETCPWLCHCEKVRKYTTTNYYSSMHLYSALSFFSLYWLFLLVLHHQSFKGAKKRFRRGKAPLCHPSKMPMSEHKFWELYYLMCVQSDYHLLYTTCLSKPPGTWMCSQLAIFWIFKLSIIYRSLGKIWHEKIFVRRHV